jgi:RimJ/RimL family protein N-acetyltransferase
MMEIKIVTLEGNRVRLEPLQESHQAELCEIGLDVRLWQLTVNKVRTSEDMFRYIQGALDAQAAGTALPFVIVEKASDKIIGTTRYHNINQQHRRVEIGYTWLAVLWQRTGINTEVKYLMLNYAFEVWGCVRVEFRVNSINEPSRRALLRIGAKQEGVLRNYMISEHNDPRDVAIFSIIDSEWPDVKSNLSERLKQISWHL